MASYISKGREAAGARGDFSETSKLRLLQFWQTGGNLGGNGTDVLQELNDGLPVSLHSFSWQFEALQPKSPFAPKKEFSPEPQYKKKKNKSQKNKNNQEQKSSFMINFLLHIIIWICKKIPPQKKFDSERSSCSTRPLVHCSSSSSSSSSTS